MASSVALALDHARATTVCCTPTTEDPGDEFDIVGLLARHDVITLPWCHTLLPPNEITHYDRNISLILDDGQWS